MGQLCESDLQDVTTVELQTEKAITTAAPDNDDIYLTDIDSESDNFGMPNYDNGQMSDLSSYEDNPMDQPRRRQQTGGRAAPVSVNVAEKIVTSNRAFSCGLPGGCGNGDCIQSPRGVSCKCRSGWSKNRQ